MEPSEIFKDDAFKYQLLKFLETYRLSEHQMNAICEAVDDIVDKAQLSAMERVLDMIEEAKGYNLGVLKKSSASNGQRIGEVEQKIVAFKERLDAKIEKWQTHFDGEISRLDEANKSQDKMNETKFGFLNAAVKLVIPAALSLMGGVILWLLGKK